MAVDETATLQAALLVNWVDGTEFQIRTLARSTTFQRDSADEPEHVSVAAQQQAATGRQNP